MGWILVALLVALVPILGAQWRERKTKARGISQAQRDALGSGAARWLEVTRELQARLADVEHSIKVLGAREIERKKQGLGRPVAFEVADANLFQEIQELQTRSVSWAENGHMILRDPTNRLDLTAADVPRAGIEIPWTIELGGREDRIAELQDALERCQEAGKLLGRVDEALSGAA